MSSNPPHPTPKKPRATRVACPTCGTRAGRSCWTYAGRGEFSTVNVNPHPERIRAAEASRV